MGKVGGTASAGDAVKAFRQAERRLRDLLFGDGVFSPGLVKGDERRSEVAVALRRMRLAFDQAVVESGADRVEAEARIVDLEEELRALAAAKSGRKEKAQEPRPKPAAAPRRAKK